MSVLFIMIPVALILAGIGIVAFVIAVKRGQFDDLDTPAIRAVFDDDETIPPRESSVQSNPSNQPDEETQADV